MIKCTTTPTDQKRPVDKTKDEPGAHGVVIRIKNRFGALGIRRERQTAGREGIQASQRTVEEAAMNLD